MSGIVLGLDFGICVDLENDISHLPEFGCTQHLVVC